MAIDELQIGVRTRKCLQAANADRFQLGVASLRIGQVLNLPGFGITSLVDLLTAMEVFCLRLKGESAIRAGGDETRNDLHLLPTRGVDSTEVPPLCLNIADDLEAKQAGYFPFYASLDKRSRSQICAFFGIPGFNATLGGVLALARVAVFGVKGATRTGD